jgi:hypothetical protein
MANLIVRNTRTSRRAALLDRERYVLLVRKDYEKRFGGTFVVTAYTKPDEPFVTQVMIRQLTQPEAV